MNSFNDDNHPPRPRRASIDGFLPPERSVSRPDFSQAPEATALSHQHRSADTPASYLNSSSHIALPAKPTETATNTQPEASRPRQRPVSKKKFPPRKIAALAVAFVLFSLVIGASWVGVKFLRDSSKVFGGSIASNIGDLFSSTTLKGESNGRVNLLLAGDSSDDPGHNGADLTDSIMVVSIDTKNNTGFLLSVPRDLWVNIPSLGHQKINAANDVTAFKAKGYPSGGMGQLEQVVQTDLGIPIDYYALIDYTAFKDAVNAVGGITINIQSPDPRGLYDPNIEKADGGPLLLKNGVQTIDGQVALNLARARGDPTYNGKVAYGFPNSDFDRTQHQRQMLVALKQKATTLGVVTNPIKIGQLFDAIGNNVQTDLNLADVLRLDELTKGINQSSIQSLTYSESGAKPLLKGYLADNGQEALIPTAGIDNFVQLQQYYQQQISSNPVVKEGANVIVLNGTSVSGLAKTNQAKLASKGVTVSYVGDATSTYTKTTIVDNSDGKLPATLALLKSVYGNNVTTKQIETYASNPDFIVILGADQAPPSSTPNTTN